MKQTVLVCWIIIGIFAMMTIDRNHVWRSDESLWKDTVEKSPMLPGPHLHLGIAYNERGKLDLAVKEYLTADGLAQQDERYMPIGRAAMTNAMGIALDIKRYDWAEGFYKEARRKYPLDHSLASTALVLYGQTGRLNEALVIAHEAVEINLKENETPAALAELVFNRGDIYSRLHRCDKAQEDWSRAKALNPLVDFPERKCVT